MSFRRELITDTQFDNGVRFISADAIPVYLIDGASLGAIEVAFVPVKAAAAFSSMRGASTIYHGVSSSSERTRSSSTTASIRL